MLTPLGAAGIIGTMIVAIVASHLRNGLWPSNGALVLGLGTALVRLATRGAPAPASGNA